MMSPRLQDAPSASVDLCVEQIDVLRLEIDGAIGAIAANALYDFEQSLWRQKVLCTSLAHVMQNLRTGELATPAAGRLQAAMASLQAVNQSYAAVVEQASACNERLQAVCSHFARAVQEPEFEQRGIRCSLEA